MEFASLDEALIGRDRIVRSALTPLCLEVLNPRAQEYLREPIAPRDPDHYAPQQPVSSSSGTWQLALRASGSDAVLARYRKELGSAMSREIDGDEEAEFWRAISNLVPAAASRHKNVMAATLNATSASAVQALKAVERAGLDNNLLPAIVGRAAVASFEIAFVPLSVDPPSAMQYATAISALRAQLPPECSAVVTRCPTEAKRHFDVWGPSPTYMASMRAVKRALDPKNILNRGRFLVS
jgi:FAD/FMN-containing dehydrogenase